MTVLHLQSKTNHDGKVEVSTGIPDADVDLVVVVKDNVPESPATDEEWAKNVLSLQGSITDPTFKRHPQGDFPKREPLR